jgi:uncharacterized protein (DUF433 family)
MATVPIIHEKSPRCIGHLENFEISHLSNLFASLVAQGSAKQFMCWCTHSGIGIGRGKVLDCLEGTRIPVATILGSLADGMMPEEIQEAYPQLTSEDIRAALAYAADVIHQDILMPLPA